MKELNGRLVNKSITLQLTPAALDFAVAQSYDHMYGARPLRRWLEHHILTDLSRMIVTGELNEGSTVTADAGGGALRYAVQLQHGATVSADSLDAHTAEYNGGIRQCVQIIARALRQNMPFVATCTC